MVGSNTSYDGWSRDQKTTFGCLKRSWRTIAPSTSGWPRKLRRMLDFYYNFKPLAGSFSQWVFDAPMLCDFELFSIEQTFFQRQGGCNPIALLAHVCVSNCYNNKIIYSVCSSLGFTTQQETGDDRVRSLLKQE